MLCSLENRTVSKACTVCSRVVVRSGKDVPPCGGLQAASGKNMQATRSQGGKERILENLNQGQGELQQYLLLSHFIHLGLQLKQELQCPLSLEQLTLPPPHVNSAVHEPSDPATSIVLITDTCTKFTTSWFRYMELNSPALRSSTTNNPNNFFIKTILKVKQIAHPDDTEKQNVLKVKLSSVCEFSRHIDVSFSFFFQGRKWEALMVDDFHDCSLQ